MGSIRRSRQIEGADRTASYWSQSRDEEDEGHRPPKSGTRYSETAKAERERDERVVGGAMRSTCEQVQT